jgi:hypothetical protein
MIKPKVFIVVNFHHFTNLKKAININKDFFSFFQFNFFTILIFLNDIILQWVLGLLIEIYKYFHQ